MLAILVFVVLAVISPLAVADSIEMQNGNSIVCVVPPGESYDHYDSLRGQRSTCPTVRRGVCQSR